MFAMTAPGYAAEIYSYRQSNGTILFTDQPPEKTRLTLIKGSTRPVRSSPCKGLSEQAINQHYFNHKPLYDRLSATYHIPLKLAQAVIAVESCFDAQAVSSAGAMGLMQLMPGTARELGVTEPFDVSQNLRGGFEYLARMLTRFSGDIRLALAAYHAGAATVERYQHVPPIQATQDYVSKVMAAYAGPLILELHR